ncbi:MAG: hypothetical protein GTO18_10210 [Anaerolineales bacterium]|nr:hypothetical protein [Anaerolineales bacterium]
MALTSFEVVRRAIEFETPDRIPMRFDSMGVNDFQFVNWNQVYPGDWVGISDTNYDHWGCLWERTDQINMGQIRMHPLEDWSNLETYDWPDPNDPAFYEGMDDQFIGSQDKYVLIGYFMLIYERMWALRGMENLFIDLAVEDERLEMLADRIVEFALQWMENISVRYPSQIHGVHFSDDWGTQQGLMIRPDLWRNFFKPRYKFLFEGMQSKGWHTWMHTDGKINEILEDLIEIGLDSVNLQQPRTLGIEEIGKNFRGRIAFETTCDIQHTLPKKSNAEIADEARMLVEHWATPEGGFTITDYGEGRAIGVEREKKEVMFNAFIEADPYRRKQLGS